MNTPTLYEQIGGQQPIDDCVTAFYEKVLADPKLRPFFDGVSVEKLLNMQREFFTAALGGPVTYSGMSLRGAHERLNITTAELSLFTDHLLATLEDSNLSRTVVDAIVNRIATYSEDIVGETAVDG